MPFKSKAQQRFMFAAESQGKLKPGTARKWAHETKNMKKLPEHVKKAAFADALLEELAKVASGYTYDHGSDVVDVEPKMTPEDHASKANSAWGAPGFVHKTKNRTVWSDKHSKMFKNLHKKHKQHFDSDFAAPFDWVPAYREHKRAE